MVELRWIVGEEVRLLLRLGELLCSALVDVGSGS